MQDDGIDWEAIYTELLPRVYNFFRYRVGDDSLAEDLTSATFKKSGESERVIAAVDGGLSLYHLLCNKKCPS